MQANHDRTHRLIVRTWPRSEEWKSRSELAACISPSSYHMYNRAGLH